MSFFLNQILQDKLHQEVDRIMSFVKDAVISSYKAQGHALTNSLENDAKIEIAKITNGVLGILYLNSYYKVLETGVTADRIPYQRGSGKKKSKYIDALTEYFQLRLGVDEKTAKGYAFGTANIHKQHGMPSPGSNHFSSTGQRTGFFSSAIEQSQGRITEGIESVFSEAMNAVIDKMNSQIQAKVEIRL